MRVFSSAVLEQKINNVLKQIELPEQHIKFVCDGVLKASLRGVDTHGVELLPTYVEELVAGRSNKFPNMTIKRHGSIVKIDADDALGLVAGGVAVERGLEVCAETGVAVISVANSNHFGMASVYTLSAARAGYVCIAMSHTDALIAPFNGTEKLLGTNPLSIAAPAENGDVFCFDIASSQVSFSMVKSCLANGRPIQSGWAIDAQGRDSADTGSVYALQPLGGYKGQGIGMMVTILSGILSGMPLDYEMHHLFAPPYDEPRKNGHFMLFLDVERFIGRQEFSRQLQRFLSRIRSCNRVDEDVPVVVPGDIEAAVEDERTVKGVPISEKLMGFFTEFDEVDV